MIKHNNWTIEELTGEVYKLVLDGEEGREEFLLLKSELESLKQLLDKVG